MLQRLVDINTDATAAFEKESKELLVRLADDLITVALSDKETGNWEAAEILNVVTADPLDETFIDSLKQRSSLINYKGLSTKVVVATTEAMAVPKTLAGSTSLFFQTQFGRHHSLVQTDEINEDIVFAFAPQDWQNQLISHLFPEAQIRSTLALLTYQSLGQKQEEGTCLYLHIATANAEVVLIQHGKLAIANSIPYATKEDLLYHLLNIAREFGIKPTSLSVQLQGMITEESDVHQLLRRYLAPVSFAAHISPIRHKAFWAVPPHYFTGLMLSV